MRSLPQSVVSTIGQLWSSNGIEYSIVEGSPLLLCDNIPIITNDRLFITVDGEVYDSEVQSIVNNYGDRTYSSVVELDDKIFLLSEQGELFLDSKINKPICRNVRYIGRSNTTPSGLPRNHIIVQIDDEWKIICINGTSVTYSEFEGDVITGDYITRRNTVIITTDGYWLLRGCRVRRLPTFGGMTDIIDYPYNNVAALNEDGELYYYNGGWIKSTNVIIDRLNQLDQWVRLYMFNHSLYLSNSSGELFLLDGRRVSIIDRYPLESMLIC